MKYILRRTVFAVITLPVAWVAYGLVYFGLSVFAATSTANVDSYLSMLWYVSVVWVAALAFALPLVTRQD